MKNLAARNLRICILVDNHFRGGVASAISTLLNSRFGEDVELVLITNRNNPMLDEAEISNQRLARIVYFQFLSSSKWFAGTAPWSVRGGIRFPLDTFRKFLKPFLLFHQTLFFARLFKAEKFEALLNVNGGYPGSITSRAAALGWSRGGYLGRQVMAIHSFAVPSRVGFHLIDRWIDRQVFSTVDEVITVSNSCRVSFVNRPSLALHEKVTVIPNGVENVLRDKQKRELTRKSLKLDVDQSLILMLGTYDPRKGHKFLIQSFARVVKEIPSARLICAGDDPNLMIRGLKKQIVQHGLEHSVLLLSFQSDVSGLLEASDIVAIPSQNYESFCLVAVEAFKFAKPIVATNVGAIPEIAPHGEGAILCEPGDVGSFSEALTRLSTNKAMYIEYSNKSRARFEEFGVAKMVRSYQKSLMGEL